MAKGDKGKFASLWAPASYQTQQFGHGSEAAASRAWTGGVECFHNVNVLCELAHQPASDLAVHDVHLGQSLITTGQTRRVKSALGQERRKENETKPALELAVDVL
jgi:hypothetical protein